MSQEEETESEEEDLTGEMSSPEPRDDKSFYSRAFQRIEGVVPKDMESKKDMMSFIAYAQHLENSCKLISSSKLINLSDGPNDKNRIYMSGAATMSTKLTASLAQSRKICDGLREGELV